MLQSIIQIALAFVEGFALIISPCILPILPIMLSASLTGNRSRPLGIISGFVITFTIFTLFSRWILQSLHLSHEYLRIISFAILILLGIMMLSDYLTEKFNIATNRLLSVGESLPSGRNGDSGFLSGLLFGGLIGIIWTPCAGPILAAVIVQVIIQHNNLMSLFTVAAFAIGAGLPMLLIALFGRRIMHHFNFFRNHASLIRKLLGVIIIASVIAMIFLPADFFLPKSQESSTSITQNSLLDGLQTSYAAPELMGNSAWINSPPLTIAQLKGKVVLIDFWTYSCINCIRTFPYLKDWYAKYHDKGLEIIGVHTPEFLFEHDLNNVKNAVAANGIKYPVVLDNDFKTWQNFQNEFWPAHYLINKEGKVVYVHFGEGDYGITENNIRFLLGINTPMVAKPDQVFSSQITPETYLGYDRMANFASSESVVSNRAGTYSYPAALAQDSWALRGVWTILADKIVSAGGNSAIKLHYYAKDVYAVMGSVTPSTIKIVTAGSEKKLTVSEHKLYTIIDNPVLTNAEVEIIFPNSGVEVYTFTFG